MRLVEKNKKVILAPKDRIITILDQGLEIITVGNLWHDRRRRLVLPRGVVTIGSGLKDYLREELEAAGERGQKLARKARRLGVVAQIPSWVFDPTADMENLFNAIHGAAEMTEMEFLHNGTVSPEKRTSVCHDLQRSLLDVADFRLGRG